MQVWVRYDRRRIVAVLPGKRAHPYVTSWFFPVTPLFSLSRNFLAGAPLTLWFTAFVFVFERSCIAGQQAGRAVEADARFEGAELRCWLPGWLHRWEGTLSLRAGLRMKSFGCVYFSFNILID